MATAVAAVAIGPPEVFAATSTAKNAHTAMATATITLTLTATLTATARTAGTVRLQPVSLAASRQAV